MADERVERRLAAVVAADIAGYSRLMEADETGTLGQLIALRKELIDPKIAEYRGRIVKTTGDGLLLEYASVTDAVQCSVEIQEAMALRNASVSEDRRIVFRVGINLGEIIIEGDDIYGNGVNVAARLEAMAEPGGICVSGNVYDQIQSILRLRYENLGEQTVKNISAPIRSFAVRLGNTEGPARQISESVAVDAERARASVAVLPFDNLSGDPEQEYFVDGMAEDIITELSRFKSLFVIARNSTFAFKGQSLAMKEISRRLGARYVVEGSVRKAGNRIRITAQLIDASNNAQLWAERYDRDLEDIFDIQDEVTQAIIAEIAPHLESTERERAHRKPPENLDAWECYQRGLWHLYRHTAADSARAQELFQRAIELDPDFAPPHAALGFSLYYEVVGGLVSDTGDRLPRALEDARAAIAADEWDAFGHAVLGRILLLQGEHDASIAAYETSLDLNPNYANAHYGLAFALCFTGQPEEAMRELDEAQRLSPHDPLLWAFMAIKSFALSLLRRYDEALLWAKRAQQTPSATVWAHFTEVVALAHLGRIEEAREALEQAYKVKADLSSEFFEQIFLFNDPVEMAHVMDGLRIAGLPE